MTATDDISGPTLDQQIEDFKIGLAGSAPAEVVAQFDNDVQRMIAAGIGEQAIKVGERAPEFALPDALGHEVRLTDLLAQGPVVVTFYRGEWCPYCNLTLRAYQAILPQIQALGASLVAISPQTPDNSLTTVEKKELTYPVLSDAGNRVARQFGLVYTVDEQIRSLYTAIGNDLQTFNGDASWELPVPGTFVIARDGTVRHAFVEADYRLRLEPKDLLAALRQQAGQR